MIDNKIKNSKYLDLILTSVHEAGHTIYALLHYMQVEMVYIFEDPETKEISGSTNFNYCTPDSTTDDELSKSFMYSEICINYAGLIAERLFFKSITGSDKFPAFWKNGSSEDTMKAASLIRKYDLVPPGRKRYNFKKKLINNTCQELNNNWEAIMLISHALFSGKKLFYCNLKKILTKKSNNKQFWRQQFKDINSIINDDVDEKIIRKMII